MTATFAVVLNYNDARATQRCVATLVSQLDAANIVVVDNGSRREDRARLVETCGSAGYGCTTVTLESNLGFGPGMNAGIRAAMERGAEAILLLNNDTLIEPGCVSALAADLGVSGVGVAVPVVTTGSGSTVWAIGGDVDRRTLRVRHRYAGKPVPHPVQPDDVSFAPGAALMVSAGALREVGGFVENLFLYYEDVEFSLRVTSAGYRIRICPTAVVWHAVQGGRAASTTRSMRYRSRNSLWLVKRLHGANRAALLLCLLRQVVRNLAVPLRRHGARPVVVASMYQVMLGTLAGLASTPEAASWRPGRVASLGSG